MATPHDYYMVSALIFGIGLAGVLSRRNLIVMLAGVEMMLAAANLNFVVQWRMQVLDPAQSGTVFALFSMAVAAAEIALGLGLVILVYRHYRSVSADKPCVLRDTEDDEP